MWKPITCCLSRLHPPVERTGWIAPFNTSTHATRIASCQTERSAIHSILEMHLLRSVAQQQAFTAATRRQSIAFSSPATAGTAVRRHSTFVVGDTLLSTQLTRPVATDSECVLLFLQTPLSTSTPPASAILGAYGSKPSTRSVRAMATASDGSDVPPGQELAVLVRHTGSWSLLACSCMHTTLYKEQPCT